MAGKPREIQVRFLNYAYIFYSVSYTFVEGDWPVGDLLRDPCSTL